ncbi:hypothetical protein [Borborobacter arsenicus]|uniref:hypothetical protein n=1 Tax=Borborobacter arsenicus TaxID=1851146 RepID=UPI000FFB8266|nr:hypothetical protein [Pseudaminobacter arsenicus]
MPYEGEPRLGAAEYNRMGPQPDLTIAVLADLGLSDETIGNYFGVGLEQIVAARRYALRTNWPIIGRFHDGR